jgi:ribokinase
LPVNGRVIVVGSVNVDLVATVDRLPAPGETVIGATYARHHGGKGGNQATAAARLGADVAIVGAVGNDELGVEARAALVAEGIDVTELATLPGSSGVALIVVDRHGENAIAVASGASGDVGEGLVERSLEHLSIGAGDVVLVGHEIPTPALRAALDTARRAGAMTILNPSPATGLDRALLAGADILVPNLGELAVLTLIEGRSQAAAARSLLGSGDPGSGTRAVVITLGAEGALLVRREPAAPLMVEAPLVRAVDAVGAGDTFAGALAASMAAGHDLETAIRRGVVAASLSTTRPGARGGMPTLVELEASLARS